MIDAPRPAATVLLVRDGARGLEVFLARRSGSARFMPTMWVFPGGRVDPHDEAALAHAVGGHGVAGRLGVTWARAALLAAVRETLEEVGVWVGGGSFEAEAVEEARAALRADAAAWIGVLARRGAPVDLEPLLPWARWVTPEGEGRRFDTVFLLAAASGPERGAHDGVELTDSAWVSPAQVVAAGLGVWPLAPPTFWALRELARCGAVAEVLAACADRDLRPVQPVRTVVDGRLAFLLPGEAGHPAEARPGLPVRLELGDGRWQVVWGDGEREG
jgi:8-oxo-dGTP pyrophosphatase MutT (NUDIX family)